MRKTDWLRKQKWKKNYKCKSKGLDQCSQLCIIPKNKRNSELSSLILMRWEINLLRNSIIELRHTSLILSMNTKAAKEEWDNLCRMKNIGSTKLSSSSEPLLHQNHQLNSLGNKRKNHCSQDMLPPLWLLQQSLCQSILLTNNPHLKEDKKWVLLK